MGHLAAINFDFVRGFLHQELLDRTDSGWLLFLSLQDLREFEWTFDREDIWHVASFFKLATCCR